MNFTILVGPPLFIKTKNLVCLVYSWEYRRRLLKNQDAHGPHHSPKKPVQINEYFWAKLWLYLLLNWPSRSGWEDFQNFVHVFSNSVIISHWKREGPFIWKKLEFPSHKHDLCQVLLKLAQWFWRRRFLKFVKWMHFPFYIIISPSFKQNWISFTLGCFVTSLVEISPVVLEKKMKMWNVYNNKDNDHNERQRKNFDQKSSLEPAAQVS